MTYAYFTDSERTSHAYEVTDNGRKRAPVCDNAIMSACELEPSEPGDTPCWECEALLS